MRKCIVTAFILLGLAAGSCRNSSAGGERDRTSAIQRDTAEQSVSTVYESDNLIIRQLSDHTFQHISYLHTQDFGKVACNGMIVAGGNEALVFDTPADVQSAGELIQYLSETMNYTIKAVVATHFHADCVAGLEKFHQNQIPSYAHNSTIKLLKEKGEDAMIPEHGFDGRLELTVGGSPVLAEFFGEGHTKDNIVGWYPEEKALFGGCLIKETGAGKGNLEDANEAAWAETVEKIRKKYPDASIVIPGHGKPGGTELLGYTIELFAI